MNTIYLHVEESLKDITILPPDPALGLTLINSNYPCLEHIFMVPKVFEPLKFYCTYMIDQKTDRDQSHSDLFSS